MKKTCRIVGLMLIAVMGFGLTACGDDDGGSGGSVNYTSDEIIEILTGKWGVYGHIKVTSSNSDIIMKVDGDYTGTIEFTDKQKVIAKSSEIDMSITYPEGHTSTEKTTLASVFSSYKYTITRKNGAVYISLGSGEEPNEYKIVSLTKTSFKLVKDEMREGKILGVDNHIYSVNLHIEVTIISQ